MFIGVRLTIEPLHDAVHVKGMVAPTPHRRAVIPGNVAIRTTGFECRVANATALIIDIPPPGGHAMPPLDLDLHETDCVRVMMKKTMAFVLPSFLPSLFPPS